MKQTIANIADSVVEFVQVYIFEQIKQITILDIIDILVLAIFLYYVYKFIRDRRAGKLAIGMLLILAMLVLSTLLNMHAVKFILQNFYQVGILAIIVVFQPELRAALEKVGTTSLLNLKGISSETRDKETVINEIKNICEAVSDLSRDKTGALIVIERNTKLGEYIKSGVTLDSQLSPYLLRNIFFNKAPLHDGAVIIRNARIYAAGCFLPLSMRDDIFKDLGTRHRAAIGMSEVSDAAVIIVSEETGIISVAHDGMLKRNFNYNSLKQELTELLLPPVPTTLSSKERKTKSERGRS